MTFNDVRILRQFKDCLDLKSLKLSENNASSSAILWLSETALNDNLSKSIRILFFI